MNREKIKMLIELSQSVEEADEVIVSIGFTHVREKIAFLKGMFDFTLIGRSDSTHVSAVDAETMDYFAILSAIISTRWED